MNLSNNKIKFSFLVILLLILLIIPFTFAVTGSYTLPYAEETISIEEDATVNIMDEITYSISGTVNGVTRVIPLSGQQSISDITVETPGYYNTLEIQESNSQVTLKVWLYKDEEKTQKLSDEDVKVIYHYNFLKGVKIYNDIAEFQYLSWGNGWNQPVESLKTSIKIPGTNDNVEYWNNPDTYLESSSWTTSNELTSTYKNIPSETSVEQRILMPKEFFTSTVNADVINKDAKAQIEKDQEEYKNQQSFNNFLSGIPAILSALLILLPVGMYIKWGRDPKITYKADYESQLPTDDSPVFVNAMMAGIVEQVDENAFTATLLDLIDRHYYKIVFSNEEDTILRRYDKETFNLKLHEIDIIEFLSQFENEKQEISLKKINENSGTVQQFVHAWKIDAMRDVPINKVRKYYNKSKENFMSGYNILSIFLGVVFIIALLHYGQGKLVLLGLILSTILIIEQVLIFFFIDTPLGTWTKEGKEFHDKWENFEKYINDFSLIKERPPASIQVWGKILVYATALGCADKVTENMKKYVKFSNMSEAVLYDNDIVSLGYFYGLHHIRSTFIPIGIYNNSFENNQFDTGSFGDIGGPGSGGFGGGGGGVF